MAYPPFEYFNDVSKIDSEKGLCEENITIIKELLDYKTEFIINPKYGSCGFGYGDTHSDFINFIKDDMVNYGIIKLIEELNIDSLLKCKIIYRKDASDDYYDEIFTKNEIIDVVNNKDHELYDVFIKEIINEVLGNRFHPLTLFTFKEYCRVHNEHMGLQIISIPYVIRNCIRIKSYDGKEDFVIDEGVHLSKLLDKEMKRGQSNKEATAIFRYIKRFHLIIEYLSDYSIKKKYCKKYKLGPTLEEIEDYFFEYDSE